MNGDAKSDSETRGRRKLPSNYRLTNKDVCCSCGRECRYYPGNIEFRLFIRRTFGYSQLIAASTKKSERKLLLSSLVRQAQAAGYQFLKADNDGTFFCLGNEEVRQKIAQYVRHEIALAFKKKKKNDHDERQEVFSSQFPIRRQEPLLPSVEYTMIHESDHEEIQLLHRPMEKNTRTRPIADIPDGTYVDYWIYRG